MADEPKSRPRRRRHLKRLKRLKPSRRHVRSALLATAPTTALIGLGAMQAPARAPAAVSISAGMTPKEADERRQQPEIAAIPAKPQPEVVEASYYGDEFAGRPTANGETFDPDLLTAAHRTLPFGSLVEVSDEFSGRSVVVRINDRGPFHGDRAIDLSEAAAKKIGLADAGTGRVSVNVVGMA